MTKCTITGCRNLQTTCADCGRVVCTKTFSPHVNKEQIHNIIFNSIQSLFDHIGDDFDKLVHLEDWIEKWIDDYLEEKFK